MINGQSANTKKPRYSQKFIQQYESIPGITKSSRGDEFAFCKYCKKDISIAHSGMYDIERHRGTNVHKDYERVAKSQGNISQYMVKPRPSNNEMKVTKVEAMMTELLVALNVPLTMSDMVTRVVKCVFDDSETAQKYQCSRSKSTVINKEMAKSASDGLAAKMRQGPFTISTDGSNDQKDKQYPIVVSVPGDKGVETGLLSVQVTNLPGTGSNIFRLLHNELLANKIPWSNCLTFGSDNCNVMVGQKLGVMGNIKDHNKQVFSSGCLCHLIHIAAEKASQELPFSLDNVLIDIYYYLDKSSKHH